MTNQLIIVSGLVILIFSLVILSVIQDPSEQLRPRAVKEMQKQANQLPTQPILDQTSQQPDIAGSIDQNSEQPSSDPATGEYQTKQVVTDDSVNVSIKQQVVTDQPVNNKIDIKIDTNESPPVVDIHTE